LYQEDFILAEVSNKKIDKRQFELDKSYAQPGVVVTDRTLKDTENGLTYFVPANPADLDRVIESALTGKDFTPTPLPSRAAIIVRWLFIILGLAMMIYAVSMKFIKKKE
jgi:hypothetical protein